MKIRIFSTTQFEGFHRWPESPDPILATMHRHIFHVRAELVVEDPDREVEFIELKRRINRKIEQLKQEPGVNEWSCETWAIKLLNSIPLTACEVSEDGENGARVER